MQAKQPKCEQNRMQKIGKKCKKSVQKVARNQAREYREKWQGTRRESMEESQPGKYARKEQGTKQRLTRQKRIQDKQQGTLQENMQPKQQESRQESMHERHQ